MGGVTMNSTHRASGHFLVCLVICSQCSFIRFLSFALLFVLTARAAALICSLARSLASELMGKRHFYIEWVRRFHIISTHCARVVSFPTMYKHLPLRLQVGSWSSKSGIELREDLNTSSTSIMDQLKVTHLRIVTIEVIPFLDRLCLRFNVCSQMI